MTIESVSVVLILVKAELRSEVNGIGIELYELT